MSRSWPTRLVNTSFVAISIAAVFLTAPSAVSESSKPLIFGADEEPPEDEYSLLVHKFVEALKEGDEDAVRSMMSPTMLVRTERELGAESVHRIIAERFIPFFSDFASLEPTANSMKTKDAAGHEGLAFFRSFTSTAGTEKPFVVYVLRESGKLVIGNLVLDQTMKAMGLNQTSKTFSAESGSR